MTVYKMVAKKNGGFYPLFFDKHREFILNEWMHCEFHPTKNFAERSLNGTGEDALGGWHCCYQPVAPHLSEQLANGEQRVWIECEAKGLTQKYDRPESQGGAWLLVEWLKPLREVPYSEVRELQKNY